jgi:drug/metabolite transporter (DMT)-like permease
MTKPSLGRDDTLASSQLTAHPRLWQILLAFAIIYLVWGSTYLAIRVGVREVPPFLFAAMRFVVAGAFLFAWMRARGTPMPSAREWAASAFLAVLIFVFDYGLLFWAERRVPSGIAAVMLATIPVFMAIGEIAILRNERMTARLGTALLLGIAGVAVLVGPSMNLGGAPVDRSGACALIVAAMSWSLASSLSRKLPQPAAKTMSSGVQMLSGGILLLLASLLLGELRGFHIQKVSRESWMALAYLIVAGSIIAYTAYVWLIHYESPTKVGTYAYVNPVVAVLIGYFFGGEPLGARTILGTLCVLLSVVVITTAKSGKRAQSKREPAAEVIVEN